MALEPQSYFYFLRWYFNGDSIGNSLRRDIRRTFCHSSEEEERMSG